MFDRSLVLGCSPHMRLLGSAIAVVAGIMLAGCHDTATENRGSRRNALSAVESPEVESNQERSPGNPDPLQAALDRMKRGQPQEALQIVMQVLSDHPENAQALGLAIDIHAARGEFAEAADFGARLANVQAQGAPGLLAQCFDWNLRSGRYDLAEANLLAAIKIAPNYVHTRRLLVQLYNSQGRRMETREHVFELIRLKAVVWNEILSLVDLRDPFTLVSFDDVTSHSGSALFDLGKMRTSYASFASDHDEVIANVKEIVGAFPKSPAASAFYGRLLVENGREAELIDWFANTPQGIQQQPEYWTTIATWLQQHERHREAIRAYGEALRLDAGNREALRSLIASLDRTGAEQETVALRKQLAILDQIFRTAKGADPEQAMSIASDLQKLARPWEALAWMMRSAQLHGNLRDIAPELDRRAARVAQWESSASHQQIAAARLKKLLEFNIEDFPLPKVDELAALNSDSAIAARIDEQSSDRNEHGGEPESRIRFDDIARDVGLDIDTPTGFFDQPDSFYIYQVDGSGIGVLDFDLDGRPDLYVMQSGGLPNDPEGSNPNQLFRSQPDRPFVDVSVETGTGDRNYGAGVAVGDVNQDGFPDLLLGNVGKSALYINQGDGTFRNASSLIQENPAVWTSSFAIADLSGDHLPELIQVNYIDDETAFEIKCQGGYLHCQPQQFHAATDRVLKGNNDGTFSTWKSITTIADNPKLGLGVVVANFEGQHGNDFFVANDGDLNHYWTSTPAVGDSDETFEVVESAGLRGCSIGQGGISQACMGIAAGDFNRDGLLDLHVTNFYHEPVNLFMQNRLGYFSDQATRYGLNSLSIPVLGFGTQARDFDNDGWLDLAVANGHVYDASDQQVPFRMKSQLFKGNRTGFTSVQADAAGPYWQREHLGRALATWDFNGDGRMDLVANHLDQPVAVLQNNSAAQNWLQFELVGTTSERDAIGATISVTAGDESWTAFRTAGDGYMVSNEAVLHFGIGDLQTLDRVEVHWPSGKTQSFENVAANARYLVIEGASELHQRESSR